MTRQLGVVLGALVVFLFVVALVDFTQGVIDVGACGVGPAAPSGVTCQELDR